MKRLRDLLNVIKQYNYKKDELICETGSKAENFFIVKSGIVKVSGEVSGKKWHKYYSTHDYFGESAVLKGCNRKADAAAYTDCELLA